MEAPRTGLSLADLNAAIKIHHQQMYEDTNEGLQCKGCGGKVQFIPCDVAVHYARPGGPCVGDLGEVEHFPLPYCPQCEGKPVSKNTCVHMGTERTRKAFGRILEDTGQMELV